MSKKVFETVLLKWDTDFFEVISARINLWNVANKKSQEVIFEFCKHCEFVTIANINNLTENNHWIGSRTNAFLADINLQFKKNLSRKSEPKEDKTTYITNNLPFNTQVLDIASFSFTHSRFYNDPKLPENKTKKFYSHWTECAFNREDKYFVLCMRDGKVAGYILFSINDAKSIIELIAVDVNYRGQRVGQSLIHTLEAYAYNKGIMQIQVGTQCDNIPAIQLYMKMGFSYMNCRSIYHLWV